jgi:hypothetical protein
MPNELNCRPIALSIRSSSEAGPIQESNLTIASRWLLAQPDPAICRLHWEPTQLVWSIFVRGTESDCRARKRAGCGALVVPAMQALQGTSLLLTANIVKV